MRTSASAIIAIVISILAVMAGTAPAKAATTEATGVFRNPINTGADPSVVYFQGSYYIATTQGDRIRVWHSPSIATLLNAPHTDVWKDSDPSRNTQMWAPALYRFDAGSGPHWYIYYTASDGVDANHRNYVVESDGDDPLGPYHFKSILADTGEYAIDGEPFTHDGKLYFTWSSNGRGMGGGPQQVYAIAMSNPWTTTGSRVALPVDGGGCSEVREGPTTLQHGGQTFLTYSTCDTGKPDYQLWMISVPDGADPMVPANWVTYAGPVFASNPAAGVWGVGHHFFFKSPDGTEDWIAYHGKNTSAYDYGWRTSRAQKFTWNADGTPNFGTPVALGADVPLPSGDPGPSPQAVNDTDTAVTYTGTWSSGSGCGLQCFNGDDHWSGNTGDTATFHFTGTQIALLSVRDVGNGIAAMSIDGGAETTVDYYGSPRVGQQLNYLSPVLPAGAHTLTVRVTGQKNASSSSTVISIDRAEIYP